MIDFISYFSKTKRTQSKTMSTKINQTSSQIRSGEESLYLHEPTHNMIDFYELLGINASTDGIE